jgi:large subunit ribosomal protein L30e
MLKIIEKAIKNAISTNKYKTGTKEVFKSIKGSKLLVTSSSIPSKDRKKVEEYAKSFDIPIYNFEGNSVQLGKICNRPYRVTVISLKTGTNEEIDSIVSEIEKEKTEKNA